MSDDVRRKTLAFLLLAVVMTVTLAASLSQLTLSPGIPLPKPERSDASLPSEPVPMLSISVDTLIRALLILMLAFGLAYTIYRLVKGASFRELVRPILTILAVGVLAPVALLMLLSLFTIHITPAPDELEALPPVMDAPGRPLGPMPPFFLWLAWIALGVAIVFAAVWLIRWQPRRNQGATLLALEAERALDAIRLGLDLQNVIISCYRQMSLLLQKEQDIELKDTMTAREFERLLGIKGFPEAPVHQLTQLFETARYAHRPPAPGDEDRAIGCLEAIVQHARAAKGA